MFDWVNDGIRYLGWIIYVGMNYFISSIYNVLVSIPNSLNDIFNNETVNSLFNASRNLFIVFVSLMIVIVVISHMFDWNVNKMLGQIKKIFLLCLILITLPWIFNQALKLTNGFIKASDNVMISEQNETNETNLGVNLANIYIYKNKMYESSPDYNLISDNPFSEQKDITNGDILNKTIKNDKGDDIYVYSYLNPVLGLILNLAFIILLSLTTFKVYGYLYNIIVIKIWIPIKMIYDGLNENPVSESIYEIIAAFTSFAIQLVIIPFSVLMLNIFSSQVNDNIFLQIVSVLVALWFMFTGVDYIQSKFQGQSGVPTILEAYSYVKMAEVGIKGAKGIASAFPNSDSSGVQNISNSNDEFINTGREHDFNADNLSSMDTNDNDSNSQNQEASGNAYGTDPSSNDGNNNLYSNDMSDVNNSSVDNLDENVSNQVLDEDDVNSGINNNIAENITSGENMSGQSTAVFDEINASTNSEDVHLNKDEINNTNEENNMGGYNTETVSGNEELNPNLNNQNDVIPNNENIENIQKTEVHDNSISDDDSSNIINTDNSTLRENGVDNNQTVGTTGAYNNYVDGVNLNEDIKYPATDKQVSYARSLGINPEGKDKYELGQEIENIKSSNQSNYTKPTWDKVEIDEKDVVSVEELESMLNEDIKDD